MRKGDRQQREGKKEVRKMLFTMTVQNGLATAKAEGFDSTISMPVSQMQKHMEEVTKIGKLEGIKIEWNVIYA